MGSGNSLAESFVSTESEASFDDGWRTGTGRGVSVAIIDSGVEVRHPDVAGKIRASYEAREEGTRTVFRESEGIDDVGHGTACAGIISGIAPDADLYSIKVLGSAGRGDGQAFLCGLEFAVKQGYRVINLSLGTTKPQFTAPLRDLLDRAYQAGSIVVAAANNLPQPSFPSVFSSSLIAVSKSQETDRFKFGFHFGEVIELTAPGVNVRAAWLNGSYKTITGNSFACPHISGVLALLLERYPGLTPFQAKSALFAIARESSKT